MSDDKRWIALQSIRDSLRGETDRLNESILKVEAALRELGIGVGATVELFKYTDQDNIPSTESLGFRKMDSTWRLTFETSSAHDYEDVVEPLTNASRQMRVIAAQHLDELLAALAKEAEQQQLQVSEAASRFESFAASIPRSKSPPPPKSKP